MPQTTKAFIAEWTRGFGRMANRHFADGYHCGFEDAYLEKRLVGQATLRPLSLRQEFDGPITRADEEWNDGYKVGHLNGGRDSVPKDLVFEEGA